jgi:hypothetical protein
MKKELRSGSGRPLLENQVNNLTDQPSSRLTASDYPEFGTVSISSVLPRTVRKAPGSSNIRLAPPHPPGYALYMVGMVISLLGCLTEMMGRGRWVALQ